MGFSCGIIGLPNVGKSTLFNALTQTSSAQAENYPFCTIEPNLGEVAVPDARLATLAKIAASKQIVPTTMRFVDIAGLVRGAAKGEGLGNQFLGHIRAVDALVHIVRCFDDEDIAHVEGRIDPVKDVTLIETELMLADLESLERRRLPLEKKARGGDKEAKAMGALMDEALAALREGRRPPQDEAFHGLELLTTKPQLYVANITESDHDGNDYTRALSDYAAQQNMPMILLAAATEAELIALEESERADYLAALGLKEAGLNRLIAEGYRLLQLITFFTAGEKEARAWTIPHATHAAIAAGRIHSDFEKNFIRAEIIGYDDYIAHQGAAAAAKAGKMRLEGKDYLVCDGDVIYFRIGS